MNAKDQASTVVGTWAEMQRKMWDDWYGMLSNLPGMKAAAGATGAADALKEGMDAASKGGDDAARALMERMASSQGAMNRVMDFFLKSWKVVAPNLDAKTDWRPDLQRFAADWAKEATAMVQRNLGMGTHLGDLGSSMIKDWPGALGPWFGFLQQATSMGHMGEAVLGGTAGLTRLLSMEQETSALAGIGEIPRFGVSREKDAKLLRFGDAAIDLRKNSLKFHTVFAEALAKAVEATVEQLGALAEKGEKITSVRDLMRLWFRTADASLLKTFNTKEFIDVQNEFTLAGLNFRIRQRDVLEDILRKLDMPTRSELDETYKVIHELKKEVRALKKGAVDAEQAGTAKAGGATRARAARGSAKAS
jgi:class III poly(R)-hydroxyalkanoic acid synthase PhaE subunit